MIKAKEQMINYLQDLIDRTTDGGFCQLLNIIKNDCKSTEPKAFLLALKTRGEIPYLTNGQNELNQGLADFYKNLAEDLSVFLS